MIHPAAVVHPSARLHPSVDVGPCAVIDGDVELGEGCVVGPHVYLTGHTIIGAHNHFHAGAVIGDAPQDLKYKDEPTRLRIGDHNVFREYCTVHRSNKVAEETLIGSNCLFMASSHVGHNSLVGSQVIMANGSMLAGHVTVEDRAFISGLCGVHQFVRIGTLSLMQGGSVATLDVPPFCLHYDTNLLCGLNVIGLRRAGVSSEERLELKQTYRLLFRSGLSRKAALAQAGPQFQSAPAQTLIQFAATTKRGLCSDIGNQGSEEAAA